MAATAAYLLFHPEDDVVKDNKKIFMKKYHYSEEEFVPRKVRPSSAHRLLSSLRCCSKNFFVCVCMCVRERARERVCEREFCVCVCVRMLCVCVRERERECVCNNLLCIILSHPLCHYFCHVCREELVDHFPLHLKVKPTCLST